MNGDELDTLDEWHADGEGDDGSYRSIEDRAKQDSLENPGNREKRVEARRRSEQWEDHRYWERQLAKSGGRSNNPTRLAENLRVLLDSKGLSLTEAAKVIPGISDTGRSGYRWLKRVSREGLVQLDKRTRARLEMIAGYFGYSVDELRHEDIGRFVEAEKANTREELKCRRHGKMLWELLYFERHGFLADLLESLSLEQGGETPDPVGPQEKGLDERRMNACLESFYRLLETGTHDFLKELVFALYRKACPTSWGKDG